jgi:hypothetical protein
VREDRQSAATGPWSENGRPALTFPFPATRTTGWQRNRGAPAQLITLGFPFPGDRRTAGDRAGEHSAQPQVARNEQARGSSPRPGSNVAGQRFRAAGRCDAWAAEEHSARRGDHWLISIVGMLNVTRRCSAAEPTNGPALDRVGK